MTRRLALLGLVACVLPLPGMGILDGGAGGTPPRNFEGTFTDRDGTAVEATWIQSGGSLELSGELGRGNVDVPFDDIRRMDFSGGGREPLTAKITMRSGEAVDLRVRSSLAFTGRTPIGAYRIRARDLKSLELRTE